MNKKNAAAVLAALTLLAATPQVARAQGASSPSPIVVEDFYVYPVSNEEGLFPGYTNIVFKNTSSAPITDVLFYLDAGKRTLERIHARGTFSPGVTIRHNYDNNERLAFQAERVDVIAVKFADGSLWYGNPPRTSTFF